MKQLSANRMNSGTRIRTQLNRKQLLKSCSMAFALTLATAPSMAATVYYVDSLEGNDAGAGTSTESAWKSLDKVNARIFKPGDQILFRAGSRHSGQLKPNGSGTLDQPIRIDRYGEGALPRIDGEGKVSATVLLENVEGWEVRNLEVTNKGGQRQPYRRGVHILNKTLETARHLVLEGLYVHDVNGAVPKGRNAGIAILAEVPRDGGVRFDGLTIENCHIKDCERDAIRVWGSIRRDSWSPSLNVVIRRNLIEGVGGDGIVPAGCDGALVEWNTMRDCTRLGKEAGAAAGIWPWSCSNTIIQFNEVSDHKAWFDGQGFDSDFNCNNTVIQYNYSHDNEGGFLLICAPGKDEMMRMNPERRRNTDTVIRYNVSINDGFRTEGRQNYFSPIFHITGPVKNNYIYNNIIMVTKKTDPKLDRSIVAMDNWGGEWPENTLFANNIFSVAGTADFEFGKDTGTVFSNNLYYGKIENMPEDKGAVFADPQFTGPVPRDNQHGFGVLKAFMLKTGSPCLQAGINIADVPLQDFFGNPVPENKVPSIGIHNPTTQGGMNKEHD